MTKPATNTFRPPSNMVRIRAKEVSRKPFHQSSDDASDHEPDYVLLFGSESAPIVVHFKVLMACSKYCKESLVKFSDFPFIWPMILLKELPTADLKDIFNFVYKGKMEIEKNRVPSILKTARFLGIGTLAELKIEDLLDSSEVPPRTEDLFRDVEEHTSLATQSESFTQVREHINGSDPPQSDSEHDSQTSGTNSRDSPNGLPSPLNSSLVSFQLFNTRLKERRESLAPIIDQIKDPDQLRLIPYSVEKSRSITIKGEDGVPVIIQSQSSQVIDLSDSDDMES